MALHRLGQSGPSGSGGGGSGNPGRFPVASSVNTTGTKLTGVSVAAVPATEEAVYWVNTVSAPFRLDRSAAAAALVVDNIRIASVNGEANSRWVRLQWENPTLQAQLVWWVNKDTGDDENDGLTAGTPLLSVPEIGRRAWNAHYVANCQINVRRTSVVVVDDADGLLDWFTTPIDSNISVNIVGVATVVANGTGTLSASQQQILNVAETITDAAQTWAANSLISSTAGIRMVRKKTTGAWHAMVLEAISATEVMISPPTNVSETPTATPGNNGVQPVAGDDYEVCSLTPWPEIRCKPGGRARKYLIDTVASTAPTASNGRLQSFDLVQAILCGWRVPYDCNQQDIVNVFTSCFASTVSLGPTVPRSCGFLGATSLQNGFSLNLQTFQNTWSGSGSNFQIRHNGALDCCGITFFHNIGAFACFVVDFMSRLSLANGQLWGSGMTSQLIGADRSIVYGGNNAQATTSDPNRFFLNSIVTNSVPMVDEVTGGAIHA